MEKLERIKTIMFEVEPMMNGESNCCLKLSIMCINCIEISFSGVDRCFSVWE